MKYSPWVIMVSMACVVSAAGGCSKKDQPGTSTAPEAEPVISRSQEQTAAVAPAEAIAYAQKLETVTAQKEYLIGRAQEFYNSEKFQQVVDVAQYVLQYLDKESSQARSLLEQSEAKLSAAAQSAGRGDMQQKSGTLGQ